MPPIDPLIGRQFAGFRLEQLLGQGGMAKVYFGWDVKLQRPVAIKVIAESYRSNPDYVERFLREARTVASWHHPNILQVYSAGEEDGYYYFVMEYVRGLDLERLFAQYRQAGRQMPYGEIVRISRAIASALDYAHGKGVIHRDVKPSNVIVAEDGRVVLADFGLALQSSEGTLGQVFGSPHYISPEQARSSANAVPQSDLYSFGVILYELLTGQTPFDDPSPTALALQHMTQEPPAPHVLNPHLSPAVEAVLLKALRKAPRERYQTAHALVDALESALQTGVEDSQPVTMRMLSPSPVPAAVGPAPPNGPPVQSRQIAAAQPVAKSLPFRRFLSCGILLLGALILVVAGVFAVNRPGQPIGFVMPSPTATRPSPTQTPLPPTLTPTATLDLAATQTAAAPTATATASPTPTITETRTPRPTATYTASPAPVYQLLFFKRSDDSMYVVNQGNEDVPLEPLTLGEGPGQMHGEEWGVEMLKPDQCVALWKDIGKPDLPKGLKCKRVGEIVKRGGEDRFWANPYKVFYKDQEVGSCPKSPERCELEFTSP